MSRGSVGHIFGYLFSPDGRRYTSRVMYESDISGGEEANKH